ncbi:aspartate-rich protein 1-like isoform X2 [Gorilla gorilla gorilla]|uniref:aspartate-rich protein 1-like isoform X2 n=1 Tax=Gorilla gorilla gorilla TaxID=9595 RepID=UPI002445E65F|nr:aspartate-rich protein 1-like isoform X2 [Gorilla gorilla gorilla]
MGNILTCCVCPKVSSNCGWPRGKVASSYESDIYEAVAAATSESTTVEPGKLDVGATEGQDLQHISNQKMPTGSVPYLEDCALDIVEDMLPEMVNYTAQNSYGPPENRLSLKFVPPSEEDNEDGQILPSRFQDSPEDSLSLVSLPRSEDYDGDEDDDDDDDDDDDAHISPSRFQDDLSENTCSFLPLPLQNIRAFGVGHSSVTGSHLILETEFLCGVPRSIGEMDPHLMNC